MPDSPGRPRSSRTRADRLRRLHTNREILTLVNVWDVASARTVAQLPRCQAIATASAAIAAAHGYPDGGHLPVDLMLATVGRIAAAVDLPVSADLEDGYGDVDTTIRRAIEAGAVGVNLEDGMRPLHAAVDIVERAVRAAQAEGVGLVLNARTDCYLHGQMTAEDAEHEASVRGRAFLGAGADCVFVPGCTDLSAIVRLAESFGPGRLSVLSSPRGPTPGQLQEVGVARVSYGPFPHRHALDSLADMASQILHLETADPAP